ncbi:hypothetical protein AXXA_11630 [Achromobacter insuavis AXX-A]|uniref:Uncharacterized protein n=1 Tax=Achromobacter insuavis AXX-A TaxID=1003200 RepID=F7T066_9BURK|nr:hypothetical protein AXXA_11630 [Achromobacter insuavis AXX-A]
MRSASATVAREVSRSEDEELEARLAMEALLTC